MLVVELKCKTPILPMRKAANREADAPKSIHSLNNYFFFIIVVLDGGTLWHLQKCLQCIKCIILEFTLHRPLTHESNISTDLRGLLAFWYLGWNGSHSPTPCILFVCCEICDHKLYFSICFHFLEAGFKIALLILLTKNF
jgi:hypothetical protein